jgi:hypothetical protein
MTGSISDHGSDLAMRLAVASDRAALAEYARRRKVCDATREPLDAAAAVAMTVTVAPGVSKFAMVTAAYWDAGEGALSSADPEVDPDVLDGRSLFGRDAGQRGEPRALSSAAVRKPRLSHSRRPVQRPRPSAPASSGPTRRLS